MFSVSLPCWHNTKVSLRVDLLSVWVWWRASIRWVLKVFFFFSKDRWLFTDAATTTWTFYNTRQPWLSSCNESWKFTISRHTRYSCRKFACGETRETSFAYEQPFVGKLVYCNHWVVSNSLFHCTSSKSGWCSNCLCSPTCLCNCAAVCWSWFPAIFWLLNFKGTVFLRNF